MNPTRKALVALLARAAVALLFGTTPAVAAHNRIIHAHPAAKKSAPAPGTSLPQPPMVRCSFKTEMVGFFCDAEANGDGG